MIGGKATHEDEAPSASEDASEVEDEESIQPVMITLKTLKRKGAGKAVKEKKKKSSKGREVSGSYCDELELSRLCACASVWVGGRSFLGNVIEAKQRRVH